MMARKRLVPFSSISNGIIIIFAFIFSEPALSENTPVRAKDNNYVNDVYISGDSGRCRLINPSILPFEKDLRVECVGKEDHFYETHCDDLTIGTGSLRGTYYAIASDIKELLKVDCINLIVKDTDGSFKNIKLVHKKRNFHLGIVQDDAFFYEKTKAFTDKLRLVFPLHLEEVHVVAHSSITSWTQVENSLIREGEIVESCRDENFTEPTIAECIKTEQSKYVEECMNERKEKEALRSENCDFIRIYLGTEDSGTFITSSKIMSTLGTNPYLIRPNTISINEGIRKLRTHDKKGLYDVLFYVAGAPVSALESLDDKPGEYHLLDLEDYRLFKNYGKATIEKGTYNWNNNSVKTLSVRSSLITYDWSTISNPRKAYTCDLISKIVSRIDSNLTDIQQIARHKKWKEVEMRQDTLSPWTVLDC